MLDLNALQEAFRGLPYFAINKVLKKNATTGRTEWQSIVAADITSGTITATQIANRTRADSLPLGAAIAGGSGVAASATYGLLGSNTRYAGWSFDQTTTEAITLPAFVVPQDYVSGALFVLGWVNAGAGTGDVRWQMLVSGYVAANDLNGAVEANTTMTATAGAQNLLSLTTHTVAPTTAAGEVMLIQVVRVGADGLDTLTNDAGLVSLAFVYTADS